MTPATWFLVTGSALAALAIAMLRWCWSMPTRWIAGNAAAWTLLLFGCVLGGTAAGAWGVAIVGLVATSAAGILLAHAAATTPPGRAVAPDREAGLLPVGAPLHLGRRALTFVLTVPLALLAATMLGVGLRLIFIRAHLHAADASVLSLFLVPVLWAVLLVIMLMTQSRRHQLAMLAAPALVGGALLLVGGGA